MNPTVYDSIGVGYARYRRPDSRIAARLRAALGDSVRSLVNVGAGAGSYEPEDRDVVAVEPSAEMIGQRLPSSALAVRGVAEHLPLGDGSVDAAMAILTIHHWPDWRAGLLEMRRVARERVVLLTWDPDHPGFWLTDEYFPEIVEVDRQIFPSPRQIEECLGPVEIRIVPIPHDCTDGFLGAYWRRPGRYLDPEARRAISSFSRFSDADRRLARLAEALRNGEWEARHGDLMARPELDLGYRILIARGRVSPQ